mmetsp:Transcript_28745/g.63276  ORF Transcript_28745/g.63276 Transcript_28745/m.63276 type:complete len:144 (-) Transcript_28745:173-604(-)
MSLPPRRTKEPQVGRRNLGWVVDATTVHYHYMVKKRKKRGGYGVARAVLAFAGRWVSVNNNSTGKKGEGEAQTILDFASRQGREQEQKWQGAESAAAIGAVPGRGMTDVSSAGRKSTGGARREAEFFGRGVRAGQDTRCAYPG